MVWDSSYAKKVEQGAPDSNPMGREGGGIDADPAPNPRGNCALANRSYLEMMSTLFRRAVTNSSVLNESRTMSFLVMR